MLVMVAALTASLQVHAQNPETPPMEPPYTNDPEFDPVFGEDPAASSTSPIPVSPGPAPAPTPRPRPAKASTYEPRSATSSVNGKTPEKGVKMIHHPDAKKGLIRIEQDGTYIYKVKTTPKNQSGTVRFGFMQPPNIVAADGTTTFKTMYGSSELFTLMFDYEWQPFSKYGKLGLQTGFGLATAQGNGRFLNSGLEALEKYTFVAVPLNLGVIYRLEYFKRQWVAPYVSGGGTYIGVAEMRDDGKNSFTGTPAAYGAGGLMINLTAIDKQVAFNLDSEYGIGNLWLTGEFRFQKAFSEEVDFSGSLISLGFSADF